MESQGWNLHQRNQACVEFQKLLCTGMNLLGNTSKHYCFLIEQQMYCLFGLKEVFIGIIFGIKVAPVCIPCSLCRRSLAWSPKFYWRTGMDLSKKTIAQTIISIIKQQIYCFFWHEILFCRRISGVAVAQNALWRLHEFHPG